MAPLLHLCADKGVAQMMLAGRARPDSLVPVSTEFDEYEHQIWARCPRRPVPGSRNILISRSEREGDLVINDLAFD